MSIKVSRELSLSLRDACQNGDTNTTTTLPNVAIFTALGAGGGGGGSDSLCLPRQRRYVGGQTQKRGQLSCPPGGSTEDEGFANTWGSVSNRSTPDRFFAFSGHIPRASLGLTSSPIVPGEDPRPAGSFFCTFSHPRLTPGICCYALLSSPPSPADDSF